MKFIDLEIIRYCLDFYFAVDSNLLASFCAQELPVKKQSSIYRASLRPRICAMTLSISMRKKWIQLNFPDVALLGMGEGIRSLGLGSFRIPIECFIEIFAGVEPCIVCIICILLEQQYQTITVHVRIIIIIYYLFTSPDRRVHRFSLGPSHYPYPLFRP